MILIQCVEFEFGHMIKQHFALKMYKQLNSIGKYTTIHTCALQLQVMEGQAQIHQVLSKDKEMTCACIT